MDGCVKKIESRNILIKSDNIVFQCENYIIVNKEKLLKELLTEKQIEFLNFINTIDLTKNGTIKILNGEFLI